MACSRCEQRPVQARGLCHTCYEFCRRNRLIIKLVRPTLGQRLANRTDRSGDCWLWTGPIDKNTGYGQISRNRISTGTHVVALELALGRSIQPGLQANHTCDVRACVRPEHLYEGTQKQNIHDAMDRGRHVPPPNRWAVV